MDEAAVLGVLAQVAVALTGFSGLLTVFRRNAAWSAAETEGVRILLICSVGALGFSAAPLPFLIGAADPERVWTVALAAFGFYLVFLFVGGVSIVIMRGIAPRRPLLYWSLMLGEIAVAALVVFSAVDAYGLRGPAVYCAGIVWLTVVAALQFMLQVFSTFNPGAGNNPTIITTETDVKSVLDRDCLRREKEDTHA